MTSDAIYKDDEGRLKFHYLIAQTFAVCDPGKPRTSESHAQPEPSALAHHVARALWLLHQRSKDDAARQERVMFWCRLKEGCGGWAGADAEPLASDDALDAKWFSRDELCSRKDLRVSSGVKAVVARAEQLWDAGCLNVERVNRQS